MTTKKTRVKKDQRDWIHSIVIIFLLISLSFTPTLLFPISFYLCTSYLLLNKFHTTDFGTWSHLHLNWGRGTSQQSEHNKWNRKKQNKTGIQLMKYKRKGNNASYLKEKL